MTIFPDENGTKESLILQGPGASPSSLLNKMREDWDSRARENAKFYVASGANNWTDEDFFRSGEENVRNEILTDMVNICQGQDPKTLRVVEIGCGAGRLTRALANVFGEVHAVDISAEMVVLARKNLSDRPNAFVSQNDGASLSGLPSDAFDFAFSFIVFQHIPSYEIIESYVREVQRVLRPGRLFKFQVQGGAGMDPCGDDSWVGAPYSPEQARALAERCGFECRYDYGAGTQYYWLWFFKRA